MSTSNKLKIFNDPIYGFIRIPNTLIFDLIDHPYFQRLRRISQMGLSYLVYPGAHHTRFQHALGSMYLMQKAIRVLRFKEVMITQEEEDGLLAAILLHDIGHGPFSHAMESSIVKGIGHEQISLRFMEALNRIFDGKLSLAISIFTGRHPKKFLNQLISSQLDMDRLDYLKRDSFYTGVAEGNTNSDRLITMLNVVGGELVVEEKGVYSVEKFLMARRFMYWQVYLHKTGVVAEQLMIQVLRRARYLIRMGTHLEASSSLMFFLKENIDIDSFDASVLSVFSNLDDVDIMAAVKEWQYSNDFVLSSLCTMIINRRLLKITIKKNPINEAMRLKKIEKVKARFSISEEEAGYFVIGGQLENKTYDRHSHTIKILKKNGKIADVAKLSDHLGINALTKTLTKYYICYPKDAV